MSTQQDFSLGDRYTQTEGRILLSGVQALVRLPLDQHRADLARGLHTATLISGYRGSPLGGFDMLLQRNEDLLRRNEVVFIPGINEDLGATAVMGSQLTAIFAQPKYDGVLGMWYGKAPGVDRSGDVFKHANFAGVGKNGGVLAIAGDDAVAKSSTLPSHSEVAFYDALMPVLYPGSVQEVLDLGRVGFELSRYSGLWVGFKMATNIADEFGVAEVSSECVQITTPNYAHNGRPWQHTQEVRLIAPFSLAVEREIYDGRLDAALAFAAANGVNRITLNAPGAWIGMAAAGKAYYDLRQALQELGFDDDALRSYGIRLLKIGMPWPLEPGIVREFAHGLSEILVVEEKRPFIETFMRDILYDQAERPRVVGKRDERGAALVPADGELDADRLVPVLAARLAARIPTERFAARQAILKAAQQRPSLMLLPRQPYYCSGCPHNTSTVVPEGSKAGGGIGCHGMALTMDRNTVGTTQMGGEGAQWVGIAPFTDEKHLFQNLGDGTLFHSGSLAIRQAVSAGTNITYKILYNSAVAMTGGQHVDGGMSVPALTRALEAEGVGRIIVTSNEPEKYPRDAQWAKNVLVWHRDRLDEAQRALRDTPGVTVLIHDQPCAAELRRQRKRGKAPEPARRIFINEAVCEGCGDCGVKSNCLSVQPVETEFGRKTQIHQSSCNKDYSCLKGDCPSFLSIVPGEAAQKKAGPEKLHLQEDLPAPAMKSGASCQVVMTGIGGTGIVTVNQILGTAAMLEGKYVQGLDQTGLSQKGGPVVSHLKIHEHPSQESGKVATGAADCYLAFDLLTATTPQNLSRAHADKTIAIVSTSQVPTGAMITSTGVHFPDPGGLLAKINAVTRHKENVAFDAVSLADRYFASHETANIIVLGAAYQTGILPVSAESIERAITLNGVSVQKNISAFRLGRQIVVQGKLPDDRQEQADQQKQAMRTSRRVRKFIEQVGATGELKRLLDIRVPELISYQNAAYAQAYVSFVQRVVAAEKAVMPGETQLSEAVARYLFKLMAYKDEYEVARLQLSPALRQEIREQFGENATISYHLHPPFLRALGMHNKIVLGSWFDPFYRVLYTMRQLRGTALDPFGRTKIRQLERALIEEYKAGIEQELLKLTPQTYKRAVALAKLPDVIRGYEQIKERNVERYREQVRALAQDENELSLVTSQ